MKTSRQRSAIAARLAVARLAVVGVLTLCGCGDDTAGPSSDRATGAGGGATGGAGAGPGGGGAGAGAAGAGGLGAGGAGGGGGAVEPCFVGCSPDNPPVQEGELPPEVDSILDNCRRCHSPSWTELDAPFDLVSYADTQQLYNNQPVWFLMKFQAVDADTMPKTPPKLTADEKATLRAWICACAPPDGG